MVPYFHLSLFQQRVTASPKRGLNLDYVQSAFSCSEHSSALAYYITDKTPGDKRGLL